jgi:hypothetical protein
LPSRARKKIGAAGKTGCYGPRRFVEAFMPQLEAQARVIEEWFRLPESRRLHATDAVAFAFRLLQDRPEMFARNRGREPVHYDQIVSWLLPYLSRQAG